MKRKEIFEKKVLVIGMKNNVWIVIQSRKPQELLNILKVNGALSLSKANMQGNLFRPQLSHGENPGLSLGKQGLWRKVLLYWVRAMKYLKVTPGNS